jgi:hypothetical protein
MIIDFVGTTGQPRKPGSNKAGPRGNAANKPEDLDDDDGVYGSAPVVPVSIPPPSRSSGPRGEEEEEEEDVGEDEEDEEVEEDHSSLQHSNGAG